MWHAVFSIRQLKALFEPFGLIESTARKERSRYAFINFFTIRDAATAKVAVDGRVVHPGEPPLVVNYAMVRRLCVWLALLRVPTLLCRLRRRTRRTHNSHRAPRVPYCLLAGWTRK